MTRDLLHRVCLFAGVAFWSASCTEVPDNPTQPSAVGSFPISSTTASPSVSGSGSRPAERCINVFYEGTAALGLVEVAPGVFTLGALPGPVVLGDIPGVLSSVATSFDASGVNGQGAQHLQMRHTFTSTDATRPGTFVTEDRAVCAPAGPDPNVCRVNDVLDIVSGNGIFANAGGSLRNHGVIDLNNFTLTVSLGGRLCSDGL